MKEAYVLKTSKDINKHLASIVRKKYLDYKTNKLEWIIDGSIIRKK